MRVSRRLTRKDFLTAKKIGNVAEAHAQLGICKATLSIWKKMGTWPKVQAYNIERAELAKAKRTGTSTKVETTTPVKTVRRGRPLKLNKTSTAVAKTNKKVTKKANVVAKTNEEFPGFVYLNMIKEIVTPIAEGIDKLTAYLKEHTIVVKKK